LTKKYFINPALTNYLPTVIYVNASGYIELLPYINSKFEYPPYAEYLIGFKDVIKNEFFELTIILIKNTN
jgi:hypothetical protein